MEPSSFFSITCLVKLSSVFGQACSMRISCNLKTFLVHYWNHAGLFGMKIKRVPVIAWGAIMFTPTSSSPHICTCGTITLLVCEHLSAYFSYQSSFTVDSDKNSEYSSLKLALTNSGIRFAIQHKLYPIVAVVSCVARACASLP
jgi:hypothetical protein